jgi:hypothetical protein
MQLDVTFTCQTYLLRAAPGIGIRLVEALLVILPT